jgi:hypothetical protein
MLVRFPALRPRAVSAPVIRPEQVRDYPSLTDDIAVLDREVGPVFAASDRAALVHQHRYRRQQVVILVGSALVTGLGGVQAVFPGQRWPGVLLSVLAALVAAVSVTVRELATLESFFTERMKAERLRAMYFRYLSRTGRYRTEDRVTVLKRAVLAVKHGEEPAMGPLASSSSSRCSAAASRTRPTSHSEEEQVSDRAGDFHRLFLELRINDQLRFYTARRDEYRAAHRQVVIVRNALLIAAALAGVIGQFMVDTARSGWSVGAAVLAALAGAVTAYEALIGFPQLDKLYSDAARNLEEARIDWEELDPQADPTAEVERVEDVFSSERGQWGQLLVKSAAPTPPQPPPASSRGTPADPQ